MKGSSLLVVLILSCYLATTATAQNSLFPGLDSLRDSLGQLGIFDALNNFINSFPFNRLNKVPEIVGDNKKIVVGSKTRPISAKTVSANPGGNIIQKFDLSGCLEEHNRRRPADRPLDVNADLIKISMARSVEQAENREMTHDGREDTYKRLGLDVDSNGNQISYGENLYSMYSSNKGDWDLCKKALESWVDGEKAAWEEHGQSSDMWDYFYQWGHYTQCQWKTTTHVGCAGALIDNFYFEGSSDSWYAVFVTCTYQPAGNMNTGDDDEFRSNVLPLRTA